MTTISVTGAGSMDVAIRDVLAEVTNPLDFDTFARLKVPVGSSTAAGLQVQLMLESQGLQHHLRRDTRCPAGRSEPGHRARARR